ncbi:MAG: DUF362 domain-containing protein, partial [Desulfovibrionales bacterium]
FTAFDWLHGYIYARWPYFYIGVALGHHPLSRAIGPFVRWFTRNHPPSSAAATPAKISFADTYHGKVVSTEAAARLISVNQRIALPNLEPVIPYAKARDLILENPEHIAVLDCPCRASRDNPCLPLDVCLIIGDPFAGFILEHHPTRSRAVSAQEAVSILKAEHERGHVHHAFFKDAMLGRFYAICNCCSCCCGAMQAMRNGVPMLCSSGYTARVDPDHCRACGICADVCPFQAIHWSEESTRVDQDACMGCGICADRCPHEAVALLRDADKPAPLDLARLLPDILPPA